LVCVSLTNFLTLAQIDGSPKLVNKTLAPSGQIPTS